MSGVLLVAATEPELCGRPGLVCGIGPVEAAAATARALATEPPRAVVHVGIAGVRRGASVALGEVVVGESAVYEDFGVTGFNTPREVLPDHALLRAVADALDAVPLTIGTTARVGGSDECVVEAMEGFAVLRACELARVPAVEVRAISNHVEDDRSDWRIDDALVALDDALGRVLAALE